MTNPKPVDPFRFEISLSVLNHLGRNLYRNFITVLGEAISNAWDADAENVWIEIDKDSGVFSIKDDGIGMDADGFQNRFLRIGYSKRAEGVTKTKRKRPFIGAKGIGKLALLSCAKRISVFSKTRGLDDYIGGVIDNSGLDEAIRSNLTPDKYPLEGLDSELIRKLRVDHKQGTIIVFEESKDQIRNSIAHIKKMLALNFRFALIDESFSLYVNGDLVSADDLKDLMEATEFVWIINNHEDDFVSALTGLKSDALNLTTALDIRGFIGSVEKPRHLKITGTDERATIDLFVNGRLREKNILRHIPTQRVAENYIYGQIHFNAMDVPGNDPFTSSREAVVEDDVNFKALLTYLKKTAVPKIMDEWDRLRLNRGESGDEENPRKSRKERKASDLYTEVKAEYAPDQDAPEKDRVDTWLSVLRDDAEFNFTAYADCFLSENLVRKYIEAQSLAIKPKIAAKAKRWREVEADKKAKANISYEIRNADNDITYLGMDDLAFSAEGKKEDDKSQSLWRDAISYAPVRNVVGHTGLLTADAKKHLSLTHNNIKARVKKLVSGAESSPKSSPKKKKKKKKKK